MAGGPVYYSQRMVFKKTWQRFTLGGLVFAASIVVGAYMQDLALKRYSNFRGRTALYGDSTLNGGRQL